MSTYSRQNGFSLLEAIVALTIMATCLLALYAWLSTNTLALGHVNTSSLALTDARAAQAVIETINPMDDPTGSRSLPPLEIRWKSRPLTDLRQGISQAGLPTPFDLRLFEIDVEVLHNGHLVRDFTVRKTGWHVARPVLTDDL